MPESNEQQKKPNHLALRANRKNRQLDLFVKEEVVTTVSPDPIVTELEITTTTTDSSTDVVEIAVVNSGTSNNKPKSKKKTDSSDEEQKPNE